MSLSGRHRAPALCINEVALYNEAEALGFISHMINTSQILSFISQNNILLSFICVCMCAWPIWSLLFLLARLAGEWGPWDPARPPSTWLETCDMCVADICVGARVSNSCSHLCAANTLLKEPSLAPKMVFFYIYKILQLTMILSVRMSHTDFEPIEKWREV